MDPGAADAVEVVGAKTVHPEPAPGMRSSGKTPGEPSARERPAEAGGEHRRRGQRRSQRPQPRRRRRRREQAVEAARGAQGDGEREQGRESIGQPEDGAQRERAVGRVQRRLRTEAEQHRQHGERAREDRHAVASPQAEARREAEQRDPAEVFAPDRPAHGVHQVGQEERGGRGPKSSSEAPSGPVSARVLRAASSSVGSHCGAARPAVSAAASASAARCRAAAFGPRPSRSIHAACQSAKAAIVCSSHHESVVSPRQELQAQAGAERQRQTQVAGAPEPRRTRERQREPGQRVDRVGVVEGEERGAAEHEGDGSQASAGGAVPELPAERVREDAGQYEVKETEQAHREAGGQQRVERVRRVEHACLEGGEEGQPRDLVGIPERNLAAR